MNCIFCDIAKKKMDAKILYEDNLIMIIMDAFPVVEGHLLIIPKEHYVDFKSLPDELLLHINKVVRVYSDTLLSKLNKKGLTLLTNYKDAQKAKHYHLHLLPDYPSSIEDKPKDVYNILN